MEQLWIEGIRTNLPKVKMLTWTSRLYTETRQNVWSAIQNNYGREGILSIKHQNEIHVNLNIQCNLKNYTVVVIRQTNATHRTLSI